MIGTLKTSVITSLLGAVGLMHAESACAVNGYISGHITRVSTGTGSIQFMLDGGPPPSCAGVAYGWMVVDENTGKSMTALVLGLFLSGNLGIPQVTVYAAMDSNGNCAVNQIDTDGSAP
jgi:N-acetylglucosamine kinase-like BadF-type ATPase